MAGIEPSRTRPHIRYQASDSATVLAMVREGLGITLVPRKMLPKKLAGVVALPLDPPQHLQIGLAVTSQAMASPAAKLFVQTALAGRKSRHLCAECARMHGSARDSCLDHWQASIDLPEAGRFRPVPAQQNSLPLMP